MASNGLRAQWTNCRSGVRSGPNPLFFQTFGAAKTARPLSYRVFQCGARLSNTERIAKIIADVFNVDEDGESWMRLNSETRALDIIIFWRESQSRKQLNEPGDGEMH